jgi:UDP-GlcNAc:undecaprenyl-phosphate GlcNAc-1-phosphate transferase
MSLVATLALLALYLIPAPRPHHATLSFSSDTLRVTMLTEPLSDLGRCEAKTQRMVKALGSSSCPGCRVTQARCTPNLTPKQVDLLKGRGVDFPTARAPGLAIAFEGPAEAAAQLCQESARQVPRGQCIPATTASLASTLTEMSSVPSGSGVPGGFAKSFLWAAAVSALACLLIILTAPLHGRYSLDHVSSGPQKVHARAVPRLGGVAVFVGLVAGTYFATPEGSRTNSGLWLLLAASLPAFAGGLGEDLTKKFGVLARLLLTIAAGALGSVLLGATVTRLDLPLLDWALNLWPVLAVAFTAFAVGGVANSVNIIDGFNGLAGGFALVALAAMGYVANQVGDSLVLHICVLLAGSCLGFLLWNWPSGKIFLGDGGAYLVGFLLAEVAVLLVARNPEVSPWFAMAIFTLPVWETLHSIYRRGGAHGMRRPDSLHLHHKIFSLIRKIMGVSLNRGITRNMVAPSELILLTAPLVLASFNYTNTATLILIAIVNCTVLSYLYRLLR